MYSSLWLFSEMSLDDNISSVRHNAFIKVILLCMYSLTLVFHFTTFVELWWTLNHVIHQNCAHFCVNCDKACCAWSLQNNHIFGVPVQVGLLTVQLLFGYSDDLDNVWVISSQKHPTKDVFLIKGASMY